MELRRFARQEPPAVAAFAVTGLVFLLWLLNTARPSLESVGIIVSQILPLAMVAAGMTIVLLGKGIDLSLGTILALTNVIIAKLCGGGWPVLAALGIALLVAACVGAVNGTLISYAGLPPLVVTLATSSILGGVALYLLPQPGGSVPRWFSEITLQMAGPLPMSVVWLVAVPALVWWPLRRSRWGTAILAVGEDDSSAFMSGIDVRRVRAATYVLGALLASIGGVFMTMTSASGDPKIGAPFTMRAIAACVLGGTLLSGGRGTVAGSIAGAITLQLIGNLLFSLGLNGYWQYVVIGLILIVVLAVPYFVAQARIRSGAVQGVRL